jgi:hypothetical protein
MERVWASRLRWRFRGAWQWPSFAALTVVDAVLLHELPIAGEGPDWFPALLLAMFFNLVAVAVAGPLLGLLWRRRRPELPAVIAGDRAGTAALLATTAILVAVGLSHRPALERQRDAFAAQSQAVRRWLASAEDVEPVYRRNVDRADTIAFGDDLWRTCVPGDDPERALCVFVRTDQSPPGIERDTSAEPNTAFVAPF